MFLLAKRYNPQLVCQEIQQALIQQAQPACTFQLMLPVRGSGIFPSGFLVCLGYEEQPHVLIVMLPVIEVVDKDCLAVSGSFLEPQVYRHIPGYLFPVSSHIGERFVN